MQCLGEVYELNKDDLQTVSVFGAHIIPFSVWSWFIFYFAVGVITSENLKMGKYVFLSISVKKYLSYCLCK